MPIVNFARTLQARDLSTNFMAAEEANSRSKIGAKAGENEIKPEAPRPKGAPNRFHIYNLVLSLHSWHTATRPKISTKSSIFLKYTLFIFTNNISGSVLFKISVQSLPSCSAMRACHCAQAK